MRIVSLMLFSILAMLTSHWSRADAPVDFSGNWVLDDKLSDQGQGAKNSGDQSGHSHGGHGGGHGGRMGGGGQHGGTGGSQDADSHDSSDSAANSPAPNNPRLYAHALIIRQSDDVFDIAADGQRLAYRFDGRNNYGPVYGGTVALNWSAPEMVIETHPDAGGNIEEHYALSNDGKQLTLKLHIQLGGQTTQGKDIKRVFKRREDDAPIAPTATGQLP